MRWLIAAAALAAVAFTAPAEAQTRRGGKPAAAAPVDLATPTGVLTAQRRIWCTETDNEPVYWFWRGDVYSRRQGERDKLLFKVEGLNTRTCGKTTNAQRGGEGFRSVSRELLIYLDPVTGKPLSKWANPWTGETVDVLHVANDPVNGEFFPLGRDGKPVVFTGSTIGDQWFMTTTVPLFYKNPLGGDFQPEIGGTYQAAELFNFMGDLKDLTGPTPDVFKVKVGWVRISQWLPWMRMEGREGQLYFHTAGRKLKSWDDLSEVMKAEVATHYPEYRNPPPVNDPRPNETSWTYFKKVRAGEVKAPKRD